MEETLKKQDAELLQLVTFSIGEEEFGVDILSVQEIIRMMDITKVPRAPEFVEGVINLRGKVIPIIDLRRRFGLSTRDHDKHTRIIVIEINNMIVGFVVDSVSEVLRIPSSTVEPPPKRTTLWPLRTFLARTGAVRPAMAPPPSRLVAAASVALRAPSAEGHAETDAPSASEAFSVSASQAAATVSNSAVSGTISATLPACAAVGCVKTAAATPYLAASSQPSASCSSAVSA